MKHISSITGLLVAVLACTPAMAIPLAFEYFDYAPANPSLDGKTGGFGWTAPWVSTDSLLSVAADGASLDSPVYPFPPVGNRAYSPTTAQGGGAGIAVRGFAEFDMSVDGNVLYASYLAQKASASSTSSGANVELDFGGSAGAQSIRTGMTSPNGLLLSGAGLDNLATDPDTLPLSDTFFIVMKITSGAAADTVQVSAFGPSDTLPSSEPTTWTLERSDFNLDSINSARVWIGAAAEGSVDEIRLGTTWNDVTFFDPDFIQGDFDGMNGLDPNDYLILRNNMFTGTTYEQGDFDGNGTVDLRDFIGFRDAWNAQGLGAFPGPVPEPSTFVLLALGGLLCGGYLRRHGRR